MHTGYKLCWLQENSVKGNLRADKDYVGAIIKANLQTYLESDNEDEKNKAK